MARQRTLWGQNGAYIERTFGAPPSQQSGTAQVLATIPPKRARRCGINGVHWPAARLGQRRLSGVRGLLETCSAHTGLDIVRAQKLKLDGVLVSTAFASASPSARRPLGPVRLAILARRFPDIAIFALGGVTEHNISRLINTGIYGVAIVSFAGRPVLREGQR